MAKSISNGKSIGQLLEEEELALFKRAGKKTRVIVSQLNKDGSEKILYSKAN